MTKPVAVIGGGITGLTAAFYLQRAGIPVVLFESSDRVGGAIQSLHADGYLAEFGPNTILETSPIIGDLVRDAGLTERRIDPSPEAKARYVVRYKRPINMPGSPLGMFTTDLFSLRAKLAVLREPFVPRRTDGKEESVAEFVTRRLGKEFLDHAIDALVAGVYAGDPHKLSVPHAFPKLGQLEARYGSLIKGQVLGAKERKKRGEVAKDRAPKFSFDDGLQVLPDTLRSTLEDAVRLNCPVQRLELEHGEWRVFANDAGHYSAVLYAGTAFNLPELRIDTPGGRLQTASFKDVRYPPVASVVLGFKKEDVAHPCQGFGMLIPRVEGFKILGTIFSSSLFPNRAPSGHLTLTSYIGGERFPELAGLPAQELYRLTIEDLRVLLGVRGQPTFQHCVYYPRAIPQYNVGYGKFRDELTDFERKAPGLFFAGHYRDGISLGDCIVSGRRVADRIAIYLSPNTTRQASSPLQAA